MLTNIIENGFKDVLGELVKLISKEYKIPNAELTNFIKNGYKKDENNDNNSISSSIEEKSSIDETTKTEIKNFKFDKFTLSKYTCANLKELCKERKLKCSGKKEELIERLINCENPNNDIVIDTSKTKKNSSDEKLNRKIKQNEKVAELFKSRQLEELIDSNYEPPSIILCKNKMGYYEHPPTRFIFDINSKEVIGKISGETLEDCSFQELNSDDIRICHKYKFKYIIPKNLDVDNIVYVKELEENLDENDIKGEESEDENSDEEKE